LILTLQVDDEEKRKGKRTDYLDKIAGGEIMNIFRTCVQDRSCTTQGVGMLRVANNLFRIYFSVCILVLRGEEGRKNKMKGNLIFRERKSNIYLIYREIIYRFVKVYLKQLLEKKEMHLYLTCFQ
jgi:hypothetical protein